MLNKFVFWLVVLTMVTYIISSIESLISKMMFFRHLKKYKGKYAIARIKRDSQTKKFTGFYYIIEINEHGWSSGMLSDSTLLFDNQGDAVKTLSKYESWTDLTVIQL